MNELPTNPGLGNPNVPFSLLFRLKVRLFRNLLKQLVDTAPLKLLLVLLFVGVIWGGLYLIFDQVFISLRRFQDQAAIAIPYVFHVFFAAMLILLAISTAVLVYGALFIREEPTFLLASPVPPAKIVAMMYIESLFFSSWSMIMLGIPLMFAIGRAENLSWAFYFTFILTFLGFVPIPGALGLLAATLVAVFAPRLAKKTLMYSCGAAILLLVIWWGRLWNVTTAARPTVDWLHDFMHELAPLKAALLPSSWAAKTIQFSIEGRRTDAAFYLGTMISTAIFLSWASISLCGRVFPQAFARAHSYQHKQRARTGNTAVWLTDIAFFYLPPKMRLLILKDVRHFLRDPMQWSQLVILFGLLALYLVYLPRTRHEGFTAGWRALICFLNYGAVTLILSTFTSRFVFPMISLEGRQIWLVGLWPLARAKVMWAKFLYALTLTALAAMSVTALSIRALELPPALATVQAVSTLATCIALCGLAIGLGARLPSFNETNAGRISSGLGGTINLIASVGLVAINVALFGVICWYMVANDDLGRFTTPSTASFAALVVLNIGAAVSVLRLGANSFRLQEF